MDINLFTKKFHQIEITTRAFEFKDVNGVCYWDAVRYNVYQYAFQCLNNGNFNSATKCSRSFKLKLGLKSVVSRLIQQLLISFVRYNKTKRLIVKCSRHFLQNSWEDEITSQFLPMIENDSLVIETSVTKKSLFHTLYMFSYLDFNLSESIERNLDDFTTEFFNVFGSVIDVKLVVKKSLSKFRTELDFYRRFFSETEVEKVFIVQNGIQKGLFKAALESNIEVNEFQHGYIGYAHPAYSYPDYKFNDENIFLPNRLLTYSDFWNKGYHFPVKDILTVGSDNHNYACRSEKLNMQVLIVSADIYHEDLANLAKILSKELFQFDFKYKLHPNQYHQKQAIIKEFSNFKNIDVIDENMSIAECLKTSLSIICIHSTAVYEALQSGCYVYCYKRQNYSVHENLACISGFKLFDDAEQISNMLNAKCEKTEFYKTQFYIPFKREVISNLLD